MKKIGTFFRRGGAFLLTLCLLAAGLDAALTRSKVIERSDLFNHNDFEKTILFHEGQEVYDRIFYGNSVVISSYVEWASDSGYANFGIDYGVMTDLRDMLKRGDITVTQDIVLGLNYFVFYDGMDTNPTYPWHRGVLEPYLYFQRDRLQALGQSAWESFQAGGRVELPRYEEYYKFMYSGVLDEQAMAEKVATHRELYWGLGLEHYQRNLEALEEVISLCDERGIRLRAVWLPWNPSVPMPEGPAKVRQAADQIMERAGVQVLDMEQGLEQDCFHDVGHLNMEYGAFVFTEVMDPWLNS